MQMLPSLFRLATTARYFPVKQQESEGQGTEAALAACAAELQLRDKDRRSSDVADAMSEFLQPDGNDRSHDAGL